MEASMFAGTLKATDNQEGGRAIVVTEENFCDLFVVELTVQTLKAEQAYDQAIVDCEKVKAVGAERHQMIEKQPAVGARPARTEVDVIVELVRTLDSSFNAARQRGAYAEAGFAKKTKTLLQGFLPLLQAKIETRTEADAAEDWNRAEDIQNDVQADMKVIEKVAQEAIAGRVQEGLAKLFDAEKKIRLPEMLVDAEDAIGAWAVFSAGAEPNASDPSGFTALFKAAEKGREEVVRLLLAVRADASAKTSLMMGMTPLHWAACYGHAGATSALLAARADINARDDYGGTPLHCAAEGGHADLVRSLLAAKVDPTLKNEGAAKAVLGVC